jgi:transcriptional regulator with XRE-family HTH domain
MGRLGEKLKELRGNRSLYEVSKGSDVPSADLGRYEAQEYHPTKPTLKKLAEYFEVSYKELRFLHYEDNFADDPEELSAVIDWAIRKNYTSSEIKLIASLRQLPVEKHEALLNEFLKKIQDELT